MRRNPKIDLRRHFELALEGAYKHEDDMLIVMTALVRAVTSRNDKDGLSPLKMQLLERAIAAVRPETRRT